MLIKEINAEGLDKLIKERGENLEIIDVRNPEEYELIRFKGSKLIPLGELAGRMAEIDRNKTVVFICRSGSRSLAAAMMATAKKTGEVYNLKGGIGGLHEFGDKNLETSGDARTINSYLG
jgi:rhodanese-related sulfurtransferase